MFVLAFYSFSSQLIYQNVCKNGLLVDFDKIIKELFEYKTTDKLSFPPKIAKIKIHHHKINKILDQKLESGDVLDMFDILGFKYQ